MGDSAIRESPMHIVFVSTTAKVAGVVTILSAFVVSLRLDNLESLHAS